MNEHSITTATPARDAAITTALWWTLRIGAAACFIGHGAFGIIGKDAWLPFFALVGIGPEWAWRLMPAVGAIDIAAGLLVLASPRRAVFLYMAVWATWTAALRPLTGDSVFELLERAGNFGVPVALLVMSGVARDLRGWIAPAAPAVGWQHPSLRAVLVGTAVLLLVGHGGLALAGKPLLVDHVGLLGAAPSSVRVMGLVDVMLAVLLLLRPSAAMAVIAMTWKLGSEALFVVAGDPVWEFVERGGSYAAPLALAILLAHRNQGARRMLRHAAAAAVVAIATPATGWAQDHHHDEGAAVPLPDDASLLRTLRAGGNVLACRHAITVTGDEQPPEPRHPSGERALSGRGREQARAIGIAIRAARVPIGTVLTSPTVRTSESAELTFGRAEVSPWLFMSKSKDSTRALFTDAVAAGTNRVLMTHQGVLYPNLGVRRGSIAEGDCVVVRPDGEGGFSLVARLGLSEWDRLAR